jgi:SNF2 family DNA or RNA helicase
VAVLVQLGALGQKLQLIAPFQDKDRCKSIPGACWNPMLKCWECAASADMVKLVLRAWPDGQVRLDSGSRKLLEQQAQSRTAKASDPESLPDVPQARTKPWNHQKQAFWFAYPLRGAMLAMDMGTGKSKVAIDLFTNRKHKRALVICPNSVLQVWPLEFQRHCSDPDTKVVVLDSRFGTAKRAQKACEEMGKANALDHPIVFVVNYEAIWRKHLAEWALAANFDLLILDESHKIKAPGGRASMFCRDLARHIPYRIALTGTPISHSPLDIYAQYRAVDPGIFGSSFTAFRNRYAVMGGYGGHEVRGYRNLEDLHERFYSIAYRVKAEDVLELPEAVHVTRFGELAPEGLRIYRDVEAQLVADVQAGLVTVTNALTRLLRLQQITSGHITDDSGHSHIVGSEKADLLNDVLEEIPPDESVVVFCRFVNDLDAVHKTAAALGRPSMELSGRRKELAEWDACGGAVIATQIQSGSLGIDLTKARYCVYYSTGFSLGEYEQGLRRVHRPGQKKNVVYIHLTLLNTVDQKVARALDARKNVVKEVLSGFQDFHLRDDK